MNSIDLTSIPANVPSLYIPRVFSNIDEHRIRGIFDTLDMGEIDRVDIVKKTTEKGEKFNRVFIHWKYWNSGDNATQARNRILNGKEIKIIYDDPWFWKISAYREPNVRPFAKKSPTVRLQLDCDDDDRRPRTRPRDYDQQISRQRHRQEENVQLPPKKLKFKPKNKEEGEI